MPRSHPWGGDAPPFAFGPGTSTWLPQPPAWRILTAEAQDGDPSSMLELYRRALALRRRLPALGDGELDWIDVEAPLLAFRRPPGFVCVVNFGDQPMTIPAGVADGLEVLLSTEPLRRPDELPADSAVWFG